MSRYVFAFALVCGIFVPLAAMAIEESDYQTQYQYVQAWANNHMVQGTFAGKDNVPISWAKIAVPGAQGALVIFPGRTEPYLKYLEVAYDLQDLGLDIYFMDHRGQGLSGRMLADSARGYVKSFGHYIDDMKKFYDTIVRPEHDKVMFLAHSMGGGAATVYLERYPNDVVGAVLNAPMVEIDTGSYPEAVAYSVVTFQCTVGKGGEYALGQRGPNPNPTFADQTVTHSFARWSMGQDVLDAHPELLMGGATNKWIKESIEGTWEARGRAWEIRTPILMLQAGQDTYVKKGGEDWVCSRASHCTQIVLPGARHEILMEIDDLRDQAIDAIYDFADTLF